MISIERKLRTRLQLVSGCAFLTLMLFCCLNSSAETPTSNRTDDYVIGAGDLLRIYQPHVEELDGHDVRVDNSGDVDVPTIGPVHLAGSTLQQADALLSDKLRADLIHPDPTIVVQEFRSHPVSVLGSVNNPGIYQLSRPKTLITIISEAGGLRPDAGTQLRLSRKLAYGPIPDPHATQDSSAQVSVLSMDVASVMQGRNNRQNLLLKPEDVVYVEKSQLIYVAGDVRKPGGFPLDSNNSTISLMQALALAEGLQSDAAAQHARIVRPGRDHSGPAQDVPVDLKKILAGKQPDVQLEANDILFVPVSGEKRMATRTTEALIQTATGLAIWGRF